MFLNKGFSLIELMIVVGIIGILSLMALPFYQDYVTKVKLTEVGLKHLYLARQIESENQSGGALAVHSLMRGLCATDITEITTDTGGSIQCTTFDNRRLTTAIDTGNISIGIYPDYSTLSDTKFEYILQSFYFADHISSAMLQYSFAGQPITGSIRDIYTLDFIKVHGDDRFKIEHNDGTLTGFEYGKWYCALSLQDNFVSYELPRKAFSPSMCNYYGYGSNNDGIFREF